MAKHDRRTSSGQPRSSERVTILVSLLVLSALTGVREALHGFVHCDRAAGPGAMMEGTGTFCVVRRGATRSS